MKKWIINKTDIIFPSAGSAEGASLVTLKAANSDPSVTYDFSIDITNRVYDDSLLDPESQGYKTMYDEVSSAVSRLTSYRNFEYKIMCITVYAYLNIYCVKYRASK